jgi:tRNA nucleotidyltransferase/poly(A) polymerase
MNSILDIIFLRRNNFKNISASIKDLSTHKKVDQIFKVIKQNSTSGEIRYVGGCIRKILNNEVVDDIDLATNLEPQEVCEILKNNNIKFYESGIEHGTITAMIDNFKFEITTLREDVETDGRHAKIKFSKDWKKDASRRDFTINSIYSDDAGNLFDPFNGKKDLENGYIKFIGEPDKRIKEDYLRILRYLRFYSNYSKHHHDTDVIKKIKINIGGISKLSKERLFDELKKITNIKTLEKLSKDKTSSEIFLMIFPEIKNLDFFSKLKPHSYNLAREFDFIFLLMLMILDNSDNADYFLYKFNISNKDKKRIKILDNFYRENSSKKITLNDLNKIFYFSGKQAVIDILNYKIFKSKKLDLKLKEFKDHFINKIIPIMPIKADLLMSKYKISKGKILGDKIKSIEEKWVENNFNISDQEVENILKN